MRDRQLGIRWGTLAVCMAVCLSATALSFGVESSGETVFTYELTGDGAIITGCTAEVSSLVIPASLEGQPVTAIGPDAFRRNTALVSVSVPEGVRSIGSHAFYMCTKLTSVTLPSSLCSMGDCAFALCHALEAVAIPDGVTQVGMMAFSYCKALEMVSIGRSTASIGFDAFGDCLALRTLEVSADNTAYCVDNGILYDKQRTHAIKCPSALPVSDCTLPESVRVIDKNAFAKVSGLQTVVLPEALETIGDKAFDGCTGLRYAVILATEAQISTTAFSDCEQVSLVCEEDSVVYTQAGEAGLNRLPLPIGLHIACLPNKSAYVQGEPFVPDGLVVNGCYADGSETVLPPYYRLEGYDPTVIGEQTVSVICGELTADFRVTVEDKPLAGIAVTQKPSRLSYMVGEQLDTTGMVVTLRYQDSTSRTVTEGWNTNYDFSRDGTQTVIVRYRDQQTSFTVTVAPAASTPMSSSVYSIRDGFVFPITVHTTVGEFLGRMSESKDLRVVRDDAVIHDGARVATGMAVQRVQGENILHSLTLAVQGDVNGDEEISVSDMMLIKSALLQKAPLSGVQALAGDYSGDGSLSITDFIQLKAYVLGKAN